tara:strand:+ start:3270 stop:4055 length:786 start_codon:yes stop_codon:yes gene_type:complete
MNQETLASAYKFYVEQVFSDLYTLSQRDPERWRNGLGDIRSWNEAVILQELSAVREVCTDVDALLDDVATVPVSTERFHTKIMRLISSHPAIVEREYWTYSVADRTAFVSEMVTLALRAVAPTAPLPPPPLVQSLGNDVTHDESVSQVAVKQEVESRSLPFAERGDSSLVASIVSIPSRASHFPSSSTPADTMSVRSSRSRREASMPRLEETTTSQNPPPSLIRTLVPESTKSVTSTVSKVSSRSQRPQPVVDDLTTGMED